MPWRKVGLYWLAFAALAIGYWLSSPRPQPESPELERQFPESAGFLQAITSIEVQRKEQRTSVARGARGWRTADGRRVDDLVVALLETVAAQVGKGPVREADADPEPFGLRSPSLILALKGTHDEQRLVVRFGQRNPGGTGVYAQLEGRPGVYLWGLQAAYYAELLLDDGESDEAVRGK